MIPQKSKGHYIAKDTMNKLLAIIDYVSFRCGSSMDPDLTGVMDSTLSNPSLLQLDLSVVPNDAEVCSLFALTITGCPRKYVNILLAYNFKMVAYGLKLPINNFSLVVFISIR